MKMGSGNRKAVLSTVQVSILETCYTSHRPLHANGMSFTSCSLKCPSPPWWLVYVTTNDLRSFLLIKKSTIVNVMGSFVLVNGWQTPGSPNAMRPWVPVFGHRLMFSGCRRNNGMIRARCCWSKCSSGDPSSGPRPVN